MTCSNNKQVMQLLYFKIYIKFKNNYYLKKLSLFLCIRNIERSKQTNYGDISRPKCPDKNIDKARRNNKYVNKIISNIFGSKFK